MCLYLLVGGNALAYKTIDSKITEHDPFTFFKIIQGGHGHCSCCCIDASVSIANTKIVKVTAMNTNHWMVGQVPAYRYKHMPQDGCGNQSKQKWSEM